MNKMIIWVAVVCLVWVGFSETATAGAVPVSAQESFQLNELAGHDGLLTLKAGGTFPNAPKALEATEESRLKYLEAGSPELPALKAGDGAGTVLVWVVVIVVCIILLRAVGV